jgi:hypothetical protein
MNRSGQIEKIYSAKIYLQAKMQLISFLFYEMIVFGFL